MLRDEEPEERKRGIDAGHAWILVADAVVVYHDHGFSAGMNDGIRVAAQMGIPIEYRMIGRLADDV